MKVLDFIRINYGRADQDQFTTLAGTLIGCFSCNHRSCVVSEKIDFPQIKRINRLPYAACIYASAGCGTEADRMFARYFDLSQDLAIIAEAAEHQQAGDIQVAIRLYRAVLSRNPGQVDAWRLLGVALSQEGRFEEAETALRRAVDLAPDFAFAWNNLGSLLTETGRAGEAVDTFRHALTLDPGEPQALFNLGNALASAGDQTEAAGAYRAVLQAQPRHPGALIGLGHVLKTIGRQDEAITAYRDCLAVNPAYGEVWWSLANLKTYRFSDAEVWQMQGLLDQAGLSDAARVSIEFALGNPHLDHADYLRRLQSATSDPALFKAWSEGDWNIARGAFFADCIDQKIHQVSVAWPHQVTNRWAPFISMDWGSSAPSVVYFCLQAPGDVGGIPKDTLILVDELATVRDGTLNEGLDWPPSKLAEAIQERCDQWGIHPQGCGDDAKGLDDSLLQRLAGYGIHMQRPIKGRIAGWAAMRDRLVATRDNTGAPGLLVSARCQYWWQTVPFVERDPKRPEDIITSGPDHAADACRYACMAGRHARSTAPTRASARRSPHLRAG